MDRARPIDSPSRPPVYADFNKNGRHLSTAIRPQPPKFPELPTNGLCCRSSAMVVSAPCPGTTTVESGSGSNRSRIDLHEGGRRTAPKVGASDGAPKQRVTREQQRGLPRGLHQQANRSRGVPRGVEGPSLSAAERDRLVPGELERGAGGPAQGWPSARPTPNVSVCMTAWSQSQRFPAMQEDAGTRRRRHLARGHEVIEVGVGVDELHRFQTVARERLENAGRLVTGIDDQGFGGIRAGDDGAVAAEQADREAPSDQRHGRSPEAKRHATHHHHHRLRALGEDSVGQPDHADEAAIGNGGR